MRRVALFYAGSMVLAVSMAGCVSPGPEGQSSSRRELGPSPTGELVHCRPALPPPDLTALASYKIPAGSSGPQAYRVLKPYEAQCAAAAHCPLANALAEESEIVASRAGKRPAKQRSAEVQQQALAYRAAEERNRAAAEALEVFYLLAKAEANRDFAARSKTQIDAMLEEVQDLESHGIRVTKGGAEFRRQQLELLDRQAELHLSLAEANSRLRGLMGLSAEEPAAIWPEADWKVSVEAIDAQRAVCDGLCRRADLNLLRMLSERIDADSLEGVGSSFAAITGSAAAARVAPGLRRAGAGDEVDRRRRQLNEYLAGQELAAAEEIRQAVFTIDVRLQQIAVAKRQVDHFQEQLQVRRLSRGRPGNSVTALDIAAANLQLLDAQRELAQQVVAWRIAEVKLKEAQGVLVFECCGYCR